MIAADFDFFVLAARLLNILSVLAVVVLPIAAAWRDDRPLAWLRGCVVAATGSLFMQRGSAAINEAAWQLLPDLDPHLAPASILASLTLCWAGSWAVILPAIGNRISHTTFWFGKVAWCLASGVLLYLVIAVLGGIPGALAKARVGQIGDDQQAQAVHTEAVAQIRAANAVQVCRRLGELNAAVDRKVWGDSIGRNLASTAARYGLDVQAHAQRCGSQARDLSLAEMKAVVVEWDSTVGRYFARARFAPLAWQAEPSTPVLAATGIDRMGLAQYLERGLFHPLDHLAYVFGALDLGVTFVLLGETAAAVIWLLDLALRRRKDGPPEQAPSAASNLFD